jgi:hemoglobin/transferrin/lactoferrin receptor protein
VGERPLPAAQFLSTGVYAQGEWELLPGRLTATLGGRYDRIRIRNDETWNPEYLIAGGEFQEEPPGRKLVWPSRREENDSWSVDGGVRCTAAPGLELTALLSTAFRAPSLEERYEFIDLGAFLRVGNPALRPERTVSVNAGASLSRDGTSLRTDLFTSVTADLVADFEGELDGRPAYVKGNVGKSRHYGFEVAGELKIGNGTVVRFTAAYVRGEDLLARGNLPQIPPMRGTAGVSHSLEGVGTVRCDLRWAADQRNLSGNELPTPGYALLDAGLVFDPLSFGGIGVGIRGGIRNCLNRTYREHLSTLRGVTNFEPGRNFQLSATVTF